MYEWNQGNNLTYQKGRWVSDLRLRLARDEHALGIVQDAFAPADPCRFANLVPSLNSTRSLKWERKPITSCRPNKSEGHYRKRIQYIQVGDSLSRVRPTSCPCSCSLQIKSRLTQCNRPIGHSQPTAQIVCQVFLPGLKHHAKGTTTNRLDHKLS